MCFLFKLKILPGVQNEDPLVRNMAVKCLGLCALLSCEFARTHLVLFLQVTNFCNIKCFLCHKNSPMVTSDSSQLLVCVNWIIGRAV